MGLPIPEIMRSYMYTYGYKNSEKAKKVLTQLGVENNPCGSCRECTVKCVKEFDVAQRIKQVSRLVDVPDDFIG